MSLAQCRHGARNYLGKQDGHTQSLLLHCLLSSGQTVMKNVVNVCWFLQLVLFLFLTFLGSEERNIITLNPERFVKSGVLHTLSS